MKLINKAQQPNLNAKFKVGQTITVTTSHHDGRGRCDYIDRTYTVAKVNRKTIDIIDKDGDTYRLDPDTVHNILIDG